MMFSCPVTLDEDRRWRARHIVVSAALRVSFNALDCLVLVEAAVELVHIQVHV